MSDTTHTTDASAASALLARLAGDPAAVERLRQTLQRIYGHPIEDDVIRRGLIAASECAP